MENGIEQIDMAALVFAGYSAAICQANMSQLSQENMKSSAEGFDLETLKTLVT